MRKMSDTHRRVRGSDARLDSRVRALLRRRWPGALLIWSTDGSRVYRIEHEGQPAVIKIFVPMRLESGSREPLDDVLDRYHREASATEAFASSRHGIPVLDAGVRAGLPYLVTAYVDGPSLEEMIPSGLLCQEKAIEILRQLAQALADVHRLGYVHGDIKPSNVLIDRDRIVLIDFGSARTIRQLHRGGGPAYCSAGYTAPECLVRDLPETPAIDLFSLGMIAHELLGDGNPFETWVEARGQSVEHQTFQVYLDFLRRGRVERLAHRDSLPAPLAQALDRCCSVDPRSRLASAEELLLAFPPADDSPPGPLFIAA